jgi:oxygen-independent coproporphyrinogen-3 oxidase
MLEGAGYSQISGHAFIKQPQHDHIHRSDVWGGGDLLATGVGSYSYLNDSVFQNTSDWDSYVNLIKAGQSPVKRWIRLNSRQVMAREVVLGLKLFKLDRLAFRTRHGFDVLDLWGPQVASLEADGLLDVNRDAITVTRRGRIYIDIVCSVFYLPEHTEHAFHRFATEQELAEAAALKLNAAQPANGDGKHFSPLPVLAELALAR